jgi:hypothetical protein
MGCGTSGGGGQSSTVTSTTSPPPQVLAAYQNLLNRGNAVANLPLQQWQGPTIAGFNPTQQRAFAEIDQAQGAALPWINAATQYAGAGAAPVFPNVMQFNGDNLQRFENPFTQQVTQATQNLFNEQNAEQLNQVRGNAVSAGAFGGDREAVAEAETARQQQLAQDPVLAGIQSQGFNTAAQLLTGQQQLQLQGMEGDAWRAANAAYQLGNLGTTAENSLLAGAAGELGVGNQQQALQQQEINVPIAQFQQRQAYPFQTTNFLAGITEGVGPGFGGTGATTSPGPNLFGQAAGLGLTGLGLASELGAFNASPAGFATGNIAQGGVLADGTPLSADPFAGVGGAASGSLFGDFGFARGGRPMSPRALGGQAPALDAGDLADIARAERLAGASPVSMPNVSGRALPFTAPTLTQSASGADRSGGIGDVIGTAAGVAKIASLFRRGGLVPRRDIGGLVPDNAGARPAVAGAAPGPDAGNIFHIAAPGYGIGLPQISLLPHATGMAGPSWGPTLPIGGQAGSVSSPANFPPLVTPLPASVTGAGASAGSSPGASSGLAYFANPLFTRGGNQAAAIAFDPMTGRLANPSAFGLDPNTTMDGAQSILDAEARGGTFLNAADFGGGAKRGGRLPPRLGAGGDPGQGGDNAIRPSASWMDDPLIRIGAGMMASRSPFFLTQLGQGLRAAAASSKARAAPRIDASGDTARIVYGGGRSLDTMLPSNSMLAAAASS